MDTSTKKFTLDDHLATYKRSLFTDDQWKRLHWCKDVKQCENMIANIKDSDRKNKTDNDIMVGVLEFMIAGYQGLLSSDAAVFEMSCFGAVIKYENARREIEQSKYIARRVRISGKKRSWQSVLENIVSKKSDVESDGFKSLRQGKRLDASFESFVLNHTDQFSTKAVAAAWTRLRDTGYVGVGHRVDVP